MSETGPVPFGGRDRELERVDAWLDDQGAPSRLLVTSPAGRGKSALLVQWICSLQGRDITSGSGWQLAFVPISVRVGTNAPSIFYQALAQRLSDIAGRDLVPPATDAAAYYADRVRELIHDLAAAGTRVLIVLDGLDEALRGDFDSSIFPRLLPPTFRVVASARWQVGDVDSTGWLGRLNWQTGVRCDAFELEALDDAAIADVLVKMGAPVDVIAKHPDLVRRLADLTEREPLLLRFYAEDLWQIGDDIAHITRADLDSLEPGFGSYFSRWLDQQKKLWSDEGQIIDHRSVDAVLAVLAFALGPLEANDLIHLATRIHDAPPAVSAISLLEPLRRFVIGDGSYSKGYVLSHPKISQYLQKQHFHPSIAAKTRRGFVDWGRIILDSMNHGDLPTKQTPPYLLQFLCQHLQEIDADHEAFLALVSDGWRRAWFEFEGGSYRGFSHDVQVALLRLGALSKHAEHERPQVLIHKVRCVLRLSSICSRGTNVPVELLPMAVASEVLTLDQARHLAELREDSDGRTQGLVLLAPHMSESERLDLLDRVCGIGQQEARIRELIKLSEHLPPQHRTAALNYVRAILETVNTEGTVNAIREGLPTLPAEERTAAALIAEARADLISDPFSRALALADIANYLPSEKASSARSRAFAAAMSVSNYRPPINLAKLGFSLPENEPNRTTLFFEACRRADALFRALQSHMSWDRDHQITLAIEARVLALAGLAWHNSSQRAQLFDAAVTSALSMPHPYWRADLLTKLLPHLPDSLRSPISDEAMRQGQALESGNNRCHVFTKLVRFVSKERQTELVILALNSAFMIEDDYGRCLALISIAEHTHGNAHALALSHARSTLKNVAYVFHRADVLRSLACYQNQREREATLEAALGLALQVPQPFRLNSLQMLVSHLTPALRRAAINAALNDIDAGGSPFPHLHLAKIAQVAPADLQRKLLLKGFKLSKGQASYERADILLELSDLLVGSRRTKILNSAFRKIKDLEDHKIRVTLFVDLIEKLPNSDSSGVYERILDGIDAIVDDDSKGAFLAQITRRLPDEYRDELLPKAYAAARAICAEEHRATALAWLAPYLAPSQKRDAVALAFAAARLSKRDQARMNALLVVAPLLAGQERWEALDLILDCCSRLPPRPNVHCAWQITNAAYRADFKGSPSGNDRSVGRRRAVVSLSNVWQPPRQDAAWVRSAWRAGRRLRVGEQRAGASSI